MFPLILTGTKGGSGAARGSLALARGKAGLPGPLVVGQGGELPLASEQK